MNPMPNPVIDEPIDRDIPDLRTTKKKTNITRLVVVGGLLFALVLAALGITLFMKQLEKNKRQDVAEKAKERPKLATTTTTENFEAAQARIRREEAKAEEEQARQAAAAAAANPQGLPLPAGAIGVTPQGAMAAQGGQGAQGMGSGQAGRAGGMQGAANTSGGGSGGGAPRVQTVAQRRMDGDVLIQTGGGGALGGVGEGMRPVVQGEPVAMRQAAESPRGGLDEKVKPSILQAAVAVQRRDLTFLLQRGTAIPCGTITKIVSEQAGMVMCEIANDVWSADGKVVLIEKGSKAFGERREVMLQGQARIAAIWSTIDTPYGVHLDVGSLATDPLGAAGIPADVDNHFGQRFGGAILMSLIGDVGQALANRARDGGGTITFGNTATAGQDLASKTLENTINIPPTGTVNQGSATTILALRDIDFRGVYELARK